MIVATLLPNVFHNRCATNEAGRIAQPATGQSTMKGSVSRCKWSMTMSLGQHSNFALQGSMLLCASPGQTDRRQ